MPVRLLPSGQRAVLAEVADADAAHGLAQHLHHLADARIQEVVPGARTVLVVVVDPADLADIAQLIRSTSSRGPAPGASALVDIEVDYDGADLAGVARLAGLSTDEVIERHCQAHYTVEFIGFAPGFAYLAGLDPALQLPRLDSPRPSVPAGSVAIAGRYAAVYPRSSPGGWRLLGHTDAVLFDVDADPPVLLQAGTRVRFSPR
ncbi:MAG: 5-oxoprolinase subunit B family protein [Beutenbergiaceae bacterium]